PKWAYIPARTGAPAMPPYAISSNRPARRGGPVMRRPCRLSMLVLLAAAALLPASRAAAAQGDQLTWGVHITLAPTWFDPAESQGIITPYMIYYAVHDALAKPMPGQPLAPSLAESWTVSKDHLAYEFV